MKRIIYLNEDGGVCIISPTVEALERYSVEAIALKDVPPGLAFKIIDVADIPTDRTFRNAWEADISEPDGFGAESNEFQQIVEATV